MSTVSFIKGLAILGIAAAVACSSSNGGGGGGDGGSSSSSSGSGPSCSSVCAEAVAAKCTGMEDCEGECSEAEARASEKGCSDEFDAVLECVDALPDVCDVQSACGSKMDAVEDCVCAKDPSSCGQGGGPPSGSGGGLEE